MSSGNQIKVRADGPLLCTGRIEVYDAGGRLLRDAADIVLCRCGHSRDKPWCDGSHRRNGFTHDGGFSDARAEPLAEPAPLKITVRKDAMLVASGPVSIVSADGRCKTTRNKVALCRCGASASKPFCDISHKQCGFTDG